ncbi:transglutaminase domain-containing protein [Pedobacter sp. SD-b]|uniref:Transglutaminase domain-containing protein n=1 Tax=Pedobacter segetis TaxID=2793069 RepID=A0ABS1BNK4_9SPHI|nr:transglutaminase domain-containing protein [Pedobacter segetis]MBK0384460.1 transglutaminase domain-containing protein [Pedobacter segetis]
MDIHQSQDYYWADATGKKVIYNELLYPNFQQAVNAFEMIKKKYSGIHPIPFSAKDEQHIKGDFLIKNTEAAFKTWRGNIYKNIPFTDFCEYILPYRVSVEPLQDWRLAYQKQYQWLPQVFKANSLIAAINYLQADYNTWFRSNFDQGKRKEPLPRLGALQLLFRKEGPCEDIADLQVFALRSQGIPAALNIIPYWATSTYSHFTNTVFDKNSKPVQFDVGRVPATATLIREPSKVLRMTYSKQPTTLASFTNLQNIPDGFMRNTNYIDVTADYWATKDLNVTLPENPENLKTAYISVFNGMSWKPTWWGAVNQSKALFKNMPIGVLYLPGFYSKGKIKPVAYPVFHSNQPIILKPDIKIKRTIIINEQEGYLIFRPGKTYRLYYWDTAWKALGLQKVMPLAKSIIFNNVPQNALLLLVPEYSEGKERPFIITDNGKRQWF